MEAGAQGLYRGVKLKEKRQLAVISCVCDLRFNKKPTGRLLGACSGRRPMGYRFSLLTLLFSGVLLT
jgi:hypothetical protein